MNKIATPVVLLAATAMSLSACASTSKHESKYQSYSCMDLAQELGKQQANKKNAKMNELFADVDLIFSDDDSDAISAFIEGVAYNAKGQDSKKRLKVIKNMSVKKGC